MTPSEAITALLSTGLTEVAIGDLVGARQSTVNRIKRGDMQPNYDLGKALVDLAEKTAADSAQEARDAA